MLFHVEMDVRLPPDMPTEIADELRSTKGRIYHYYRGKAEVFLDVVLTGMQDLHAQLAPIVEDASLTPTERKPHLREAPSLPPQSLLP